MALHCGGRDKLEGLTTAQVCEQLVKPNTVADKSFCSVLLTQNSNIFPANWFISHSWQYLFLDVVDAIHDFSRTSKISEHQVWIWLDIFSLPQHQRTTVESEWLKTTFTQSIADMKNVLMVLSPWNQPITLTRAWCVFELYACTATNSSFNVAIPPREADAFTESLGDPNIFYQTLASISSENCTATEPADLVAIRKAITETTGFNALDRAVLSLLTEWMVRVVEDEAQLLSTEWDGKPNLDSIAAKATLGKLYFETGQYHKARPLLEDATSIANKLLGRNHPVSQHLEDEMTALCFRTGSLTLAGLMCRSRLEEKRKQLGEYHRDTLWSMNMLGDIYEAAGEYDSAEHCHLECVRRAREALGDYDLDTVKFSARLATTYLGQNRVEKARELFTFCVAYGKERWPRNHPINQRFVYGLGHATLLAGHVRGAQPLLEESAGRFAVVLGDGHPGTIRCNLSLAQVYDAEQEYEKSLPLYLKLVERSRQALGDMHRVTLEAMCALGFWYYERKEFEKAEPLLADCVDLGLKLGAVAVACGEVEKGAASLKDCLQQVEGKFGDDHSEALECLGSLASAYTHMGKYDRAIELCSRANERAKRMYGVSHGTTRRFGEMLVSVRRDGGDRGTGGDSGARVAEKKSNEVRGDGTTATMLAESTAPGTRHDIDKGGDSNGDSSEGAREDVCDRSGSGRELGINVGGFKEATAALTENAALRNENADVVGDAAMPETKSDDKIHVHSTAGEGVSDGG
ncbi:Kinesin light chain 3 [Rhizophlyctis rosea]|nr:Kinesin light chain 3 [Rhizophlyctis rosea]